MRRALAGLALALVVAGGPAALAQAPAAAPVVGPHVEGPAKLPEPAPTIPDQVYDSRIRASAAAAEQFQGALDGGWTLAASGQDLYAFELVDKHDALEGAWRDLRSVSEPAASGVIELIQRAPPGLLIRFTPTGEPPVSVALRSNLRGELEQGGKRVAVRLRKAPK